MRYIAHLMAKAKILFRFIRVLLQIGGGSKLALVRAIMLYRLDGFSGIKRGIRLIMNNGDASQVNSFGGFARNDYTEWVRRYDEINDSKRSKIKNRSDKLCFKPKISIIISVPNHNFEWLDEAIESVKKQIYPNWELCISCSAASNEQLYELLGRYAQIDSRINLTINKENKKISTSLNEALEIITGEWVAILDCNDKLAEHALYWIVEKINSIPNVGLIYSDEDRISSKGDRLYPHFKCDWNQDLFYSHNMISHLCVYRAGIIDKVGKFRAEYEGAHDYDLILRFIEVLKPQQIAHVPRILYHRREHINIPSAMANIEIEEALAGERAINDHFDRMGVKGSVRYVGYGYAPSYVIQNPVPLVSIIIPTRNRKELIAQCIDSILSKTTYSNYEIIVVDNGSNEPEIIEYFNIIRKNSKIKIIRDDGPFNFSYLNNMAVRVAKGDVIALINNDIEVISPDWLSTMVAHALRPGIGAVGAKLWYSNNTLQHGGVVLGVTGVASHSHKYSPYGSFGYASRLCLTQNISAVTAACLVVKKSIYKEVGGLNEKDLKIAFNDVDFCLRVRSAGYRNVWTPLAELYHHESQSRGLNDTYVKNEYFVKEYKYMKKIWGEQLKNDPAYSPNLTLDYSDFSYAWPPRMEII